MCKYNLKNVITSKEQYRKIFMITVMKYKKIYLE